MFFLLRLKCAVLMCSVKMLTAIQFIRTAVFNSVLFVKYKGNL